jgi:hypothetical protein
MIYKEHKLVAYISSVFLKGNYVPTSGSEPFFDVKVLIDTLDNDHPLLILLKKFTGIS